MTAELTMTKRFWIVPVLLTFGMVAASPQEPSKVAPDPPKGSPREADLAKRATAIVDAFSDNEPVFTRDGKRVVFLSNRDGLPQIYVAQVDHPEAAPTRILKTTERANSPFPLPDGKTLIFRSDHGADENWSVFTCGLDGSGLTERTPGPLMQRGSPFVPDGEPKTVFYDARVQSSPASSIYSLSLAPGS